MIQHNSLTNFFGFLKYLNELKILILFLTFCRVEECLDSGEACPLIPHGPKHYESKCVQKFTYQRMLVYDPYDKYLPFAVEVSTV